jgi:hypothetical protein
MEGKTEQAKKDLARLAVIRKEREEAAAKKKAEADGVSFPSFPISLVLSSTEDTNFNDFPFFFRYRYPLAKKAEIEAKNAAQRKGKRV